MNNPLINSGNLPDSIKYQNRQGLVIDPGPHIGIVKYNHDVTRSGRLRVYIPRLSDENDSESWKWVSYASPFMGKTQGRVDSLNNYIQEELHDGTIEEENSFQSYGMWMVPPDIGVRVLCIFIDGDPNQGFWFACINHSYDSQMIPGLGSGKYEWNPELKTHAKLKEYIDMPEGLPKQLPLSEAYLKEQVVNIDSVGKSQKFEYKKDFAEIKKYPHVYQSMRLGMQGLSHDSIRGTSTSSSLRESPSQVFGITTPGRLWMIKNGGTPSGDQLLKNFRTGGHQIVLDDGKYEDGKDQFIKIRTSKGNMILLDDTNEQIYIINAQGTAWIELSPSGNIDIFSEKDFSVRSKGNLNFHSEKDINFHCRGNFQLKSEKNINVESLQNVNLNAMSQCTFFSKGDMNIGTSSTLNHYGSSELNIKSGGDIVIKAGSKVYINSSKPGKKVDAPEKLVEQEHSKTVNINKGWWPQGTFKSITLRAPDHEPWKNHEKPKP